MIAGTVAGVAALYANAPDVDLLDIASFGFLIVPALGLPFLIRFGARLEVLCAALVIVVQVALAFSAFIDRGLSDVAMLWLVITPLFGAFVAGPKTGLLTAVTAAAAGLSVLVGSEMGHEFPMLMSETFANRYYVANVAAVAGFVAVLAWAYEGPITRYLRELAEDLKKVNGELRQELVMRRAAQDQAEAANRAKDVLLANLSHEFRTPLTAILSGTDILDLEASEEDRLVLDSMQRGAKRLLATLDGVLDLTRIEAGEQSLERVVVEVGDVVRTVASSFEDAAAAKGLGLYVSGPRVRALADPTALESVLSSLLDNAVRFTERGQVGLEVGLEDEAVRIAVVDTGVGMTEEFAALATEPFRQASEGHARTHEGLGLGLTLARRLTEAIGGRLEIETEAGRGTSVGVFLPAVLEDESGRPAARSETERRERGAYSAVGV